MPLDISTQVPRVKASELTRKEFEERFLFPQKPVILEGLLADQPCFTKWSYDFFKKEMGDVKVGIFDVKKGAADRSYKAPDDYMPFGEYLDILQGGPSPIRLFLFDIFKYNPSLKKDVSFPKITGKWNKRFMFTFFGGEGSVARNHQDMDMANVFLTQFEGERHVILFDPKYSELLYRYPFNVHSAIDVDKPDFETYPGLKYVKGYQTKLYRGDTLFMPSGFWHHIRYEKGGYGMALRSWSPNLKLRFKGLLNVAILTHLDEIFLKISPKGWYNWKKKTAVKRANKAIERAKAGAFATA